MHIELGHNYLISPDGVRRRKRTCNEFINKCNSYWIKFLFSLYFVSGFSL